MVVKPRRCARAWVRNCDFNADGDITIQEWTSCLLAPPPPRPDHLISLRFFMSLNADEGDAEPNTDYGEEEPPPDPMLPRIPIRGGVSPDGDSESRRDDDINDCLTDRQAVLDEQNVLEMDDMQEHSATGPRGTVGVCTKILENLYQGHQSRIRNLIVMLLHTTLVLCE
ncbi:hypothetical protein EVAR_72893_1, partial [Eumeta japonica]